MNTSPIQQSFTVTYGYTLHFTKAVFGKDNPQFRKVLAGRGKNGPARLMFVVDGGVADSHPDLTREIKAYCNAFPQELSCTEIMVVPGGEGAKNDQGVLEGVLKGIDRNKICRHSFVVAIGGGAVIDMAGYAAATAHRGVKLIRIPTTVLSQNDAAVGVKNGINAFGKKNFLGTFMPPFAIINDSEFLKTLDLRDWRAGISEAIKVALIKDADFFGYLERHSKQLHDRDLETMQYLIHRCAEMHMEHIASGGDPFESGSSRPLDFGHWAAHKLEQMSDYTLRHGEAVAKGIMLDVTYALGIGLIKRVDFERIMAVFEAVGLDVHIPVETDAEIDILFKGIEEFREHLGGRLTITLISGIGIKHDVHQIDRNKMKEALGLLNDSCKTKA